MIIKSARFVSPSSRHSVLIEMRIDHDGAAGRGYVTCAANTRTYKLGQCSGVKDGPAGDALIAYLRAASAGGKIRAAIDHARRQGW